MIYRACLFFPVSHRLKCNVQLSSTPYGGTPYLKTLFFTKRHLNSKMGFH